MPMDRSAAAAVVDDSEPAMSIAPIDVDRSDESLARRARAGEVDAFERLARRYQSPLLHFLSRRCDRERAQDVVQETFLRAYQAMATYRDGYSFRTWIFTIAYRQAITANRGRANRSHAAATSLDAANLASRDALPGERLERAEARREIWQIARELLSDEQFSALWLHYGQEMPARDIGRIMGRSWVWVKTNLHRARQTLRPHLASHVNGNGDS